MKGNQFFRIMYIIMHNVSLHYLHITSQLVTIATIVRLHSILFRTRHRQYQALNYADYTILSMTPSLIFVLIFIYTHGYRNYYIDSHIFYYDDSLSPADNLFPIVKYFLLNCAA